MRPVIAYQHLLAEEALLPDSQQQAAVIALDACYLSLTRRFHFGRVQGVYLHGPVGRGKTRLMDMFCECLPADQRLRLHFHHFMARVHQDLRRLQGQKNPLQRIAKEWRKQTRVLCFDECFVTDIGDAMLLFGLFDALFRQGLVLIATSNSAPEDLYKNGLQRQRFVPFIDLLKTHCQVTPVQGALDYRLRHKQQASFYHIQLGREAFARAFNLVERASCLTLLGRELPILFEDETRLWCDFFALCSGPRSHYDYMALADKYLTLYVSGVVAMGCKPIEKKLAQGTEDGYLGRKLMSESTLDDEARRFIALVDECYDRKTRLVIDAEVDIAALYQGSLLAFAFERTRSRLVEMQEPDFFAKPL